MNQTQTGLEGVVQDSDILAKGAKKEIFAIAERLMNSEEGIYGKIFHEKKTHDFILDAFHPLSPLYSMPDGVLKALHSMRGKELLCAEDGKDTLTHSIGVGIQNIAYAREHRAQQLRPTLTEEDLYLAGRAGLNHDFGKLSLSNTILCAPGDLNDIQRKKRDSHAMNGYQFLVNQGVTEPAVLLSAYGHHQNLKDGVRFPSYPTLTEEKPALIKSPSPQAELIRRFTVISDAGDALIRGRPYRSNEDFKKGISFERVVNIYRRGANGTEDGRIQFDETLIPIPITFLLRSLI